MQKLQKTTNVLQRPSISPCRCEENTSDVYLPPHSITLVQLLTQTCILISVCHGPHDFALVCIVFIFQVCHGHNDFVNIFRLQVGFTSVYCSIQKLTFLSSFAVVGSVLDVHPGTMLGRRVASNSQNRFVFILERRVQFMTPM